METEQAILKDVLGPISLEQILFFIYGTGKKIKMIIQKKMSRRMFVFFL